jgi:hypothetical protein
MMPATPSDVLTRLRAANPAEVSPERAGEPIAQANLEQILNEPGPDAAPRPPRRAHRTAAPGRRSVPSLVIVLAIMVACAGGALAATDPFGWWSANRDEARYGSNPAVHVATPKAQNIRCQPNSDSHFTCTPEQYVCTGLSTNHPSCRLSGTGQAYDKIDAIHQPVATNLSRASLLVFINRGLANHTITSSVAAKIHADLARVPDSFFTKFRIASRYGTYGSGSVSQGGRELVPPAGIPDILVCQEAQNGLSCRDLNGDLNAPIGAGVYGAVPGKGWRTALAPKVGGGMPPGIHFSDSEKQLLVDLLKTATTSHSSSGGHTAKSIPNPRPRESASHKAE